MSGKKGYKILYRENRNPGKDSEGVYHYHPELMGVYHNTEKDMIHVISESQWANQSQLLAALEAIESYSVQELGDGKIIRIGKMLTMKVKLKLRQHRLSDGSLYTKTYREGDKIPANEVVFAGIDIRPTRHFLEAVSARIEGFQRYDGAATKHEFSAKEISAAVEEIDKEFGHVTVRELGNRLGMTKYQARKFLSDMCAAGKMRMEKMGTVHVYYLT